MGNLNPLATAITNGIAARTPSLVAEILNRRSITADLAVEVGAAAAPRRWEEAEVAVPWEAEVPPFPEDRAAEVCWRSARVAEAATCRLLSVKG